jgi:L-aspartate oxidase
VIVGSGVAGLRAAATLAEAGTVLLLTKAQALEANTGYAQGGIAAAVGPNDSTARHAADTIRVGDGLCDERAVGILVDDGLRYVRELIDWGARFDRRPDGALDLAREGGHGVRRVLHARDATGREIAGTLWRRVKGHPRVRVFEHATVTSLLLRDGRCVGVRLDEQGAGPGHVLARAVLLAAGGAARAFSETTNPSVATGDGMAMAYEAGARIVDMEFVQFHPTALKVDGAPRFLLSEALRGEGARLVNDAGDAFMERYDEAGDLAPRDRVSRAMIREADRTGRPLYLTLQHLAAVRVHERFPLIAAACQSVGLDLARDRIPVGPAAHYVMGGIQTDVDGHTSVPGLFAAGEVACTGVHGANRLASNSLLEGLVFGARAAIAIRRFVDGEPQAVPDAPSMTRRAPVAPAELVDVEALRRLMWVDVGVSRSGAALRRAVGRLAAWREHLRAALGDPLDVRGSMRPTLSLVTIAHAMARAALRREESRGAHFRADFPERDDIDWRRHVADERDEEPTT